MRDTFLVHLWYLCLYPKSAKKNRESYKSILFKKFENEHICIIFEISNAYIFPSFAYVEAAGTTIGHFIRRTAIKNWYRNDKYED